MIIYIRGWVVKVEKYFVDEIRVIWRDNHNDNDKDKDKRVFIQNICIRNTFEKVELTRSPARLHTISTSSCSCSIQGMRTLKGALERVCTSSSKSLKVVTEIWLHSQNRENALILKQWLLCHTCCAAIGGTCCIASIGRPSSCTLVHHRWSGRPL